MVENNIQKTKEKKSFSDKLKNYFKNMFDFSKYSLSQIFYMICFIFLVGISVYLLYYIYFVDETILYIMVVEWFVNPIILLGIVGILLFLVIMALQGLLVPIPSELVLLAAGMIWGLFWGGMLGLAGSMLAAILCFYVSKKGGRPLAEKFIGENALEMADDLIQKHGMSAIIIARGIPFVSFDAISYTAGLVDIDFKKYAIGTFIGSIPRAFFYSYLGSILIHHEPGQPIKLADIPIEQIENISQTFNLLLLVILVVLVILFALSFMTGKMYEKKRMSGRYLAKVKQQIKENSQIKKNVLRKAILMDEELFNKKVVEWSQMLNFKIEDNTIFIDQNILTELNKLLDDEFAIMKKLREEKSNDKKT